MVVRRRGGPQRIPRPSGTKLGDPAPWADLGPGDLDLDGSSIRRAFESSGPPVRYPSTGPATRGAAVLAPLYETDDGLHVVLTRRSSALRSHSGEVSFPGGRQDEGEDLVRTALRESKEEIDLDPEAVDLVGELDHLSTLSSSAFIIPYVGLLDGAPRLRPNPSEVDAVLTVSVAELLAPEVYREERWDLFGAERSMFFFELYGDTVWGATAAMLRQLLGLATGTVARGELLH